MWLGILYAVISGFGWSLVGVAMSFFSRSGLNYRQFQLVYMALVAVLSFAIFSDFEVISSGQAPYLGKLVVVILISGVFNVFGLTLMQRAMRSGHNSLVWVIGQSALIWTFLMGILIFGDTVNWARIMGMLLLLSGMLLPVLKESSAHSTQNRKWIFLALGGFAMMGIHQMLMVWPSYWPEWQDRADIRAGLQFSGCAFGAWLLYAKERGRVPFPSLNVWAWSAGVALIATGAIRLVYMAIDVLNEHHSASIAIPLVSGFNILCFAIYTTFIIRERNKPIHYIGLALTLTGILALAW
jgi:drug/metabolite transporter (DMT)-like permease